MSRRDRRPRDGTTKLTLSERTLKAKILKRYGSVWMPSPFSRNKNMYSTCIFRRMFRYFLDNVIIFKKIYTPLSLFVISSELFFDLEFFNGLLLKLLLKINTMNVIFQYLLCDVNDASESARNTYREERKKLFN